LEKFPCLLGSPKASDLPMVQYVNTAHNVYYVKSTDGYVICMQL
jgi:hypothetical protein